MKIYSLKELISHARTNSAFYQEIYSHLAPDPELHQLPILDSASFWTANSLTENKVLTAKPDQGIVFKSGGTSGNPKYSFFTKEEWSTFTEAFGEGMTRGGLTDGERIANLFYAGDLYASFIFIMNSIEASPRNILQFPIGGAADADHIMETLDQFRIDVWAGVPTTLVKLADQVAKNKVYIPKKILFGGESLYPDQRKHLNHLFPGVLIQSIGYASVDGGLLGYADRACQHQEHRVFSETTIIEIIDEESGEVLEEVGRPGKLVLTNLTRQLMPILRYPVGDRGQWVEPKGVSEDRLFQILGRSDEGARVGPATFYYDDMANVLERFQATLRPAGFQLILRHFDQRDQLTLRIAVESPESVSSLLPSEILKAIELERPMLGDLITQKLIHPIAIQLVRVNDLVLHPRTGKLKRLLDERLKTF